MMAGSFFEQFILQSDRSAPEQPPTKARKALTMKLLSDGSVYTEYRDPRYGGWVQRTFYVRGLYVWEFPSAGGEQQKVCRFLRNHGWELSAPSSIKELPALVRREYRALCAQVYEEED